MITSRQVRKLHREGLYAEMEPKLTHIHNENPRLANWKTKVFHIHFWKYTEGKLNNTKTWHWLKKNSFKK